MNLSLPAVVMFVGGVVLMYSAIKNMTPLDVIRTAMQKPPTQGPIAPDGKGELGTPAPPRQPNPPSNTSPGTPWVSV